MLLTMIFSPLFLIKRLEKKFPTYKGLFSVCKIGREFQGPNNQIGIYILLKLLEPSLRDVNISVLNYRCQTKAHILIVCNFRIGIDKMSLRRTLEQNLY